MIEKMTDEEATMIALKQWEKSFERSFKHISFEDKLQKAINELVDTNPSEIIKWGWDIWDNTLWWIYGGKIYVIWAESWHWKSTFVNQVAMNLSRQKVKVTKYSLEDRMEDIWKEELFYSCNRIRYSNKLPAYEWTKFVNNEYWNSNSVFFDIDFAQILEFAFNDLKKLSITELDKTKNVKIDDLIRLMEEEVKAGTKVFIIDHLHYFKMDSDARRDLEIENIMHSINEIARKYNVAVFLVAHYSKLHWQEPSNDSFKDASAVKQVANIIIHIVRNKDNFTTDFKFWKMRWPIKCDWFTASFDLRTYTYKNFTNLII